MIHKIALKTTKEKISKSLAILENCRETVNAFHDFFNNIRKARQAKGPATDAEQDLLRGMLLFSASGLDSSIKQLIKDALNLVIEKDEGAQEQFREFVEKSLSIKNSGEFEIINKKLLTNVLLDNDPRNALIEELKRKLTSDSLQSKDQIYKIAAYFNIKSKDLHSDDKKLQDIFKVRNQIAHEMDIDFKPTNRNRRQRSREEMTKYSNELLILCEKFIHEVDKKIGK